MGALFGAISGGIRGYNYAKERDANPWTNRINEKKFQASVKKGVATQPDPTKHCYAYSAEYADAGHGNHKAAEFITAHGNTDGGDVTILTKVSKDAKLIARYRTTDKLFDNVTSFGYNIESNFFEAAGTINDRAHWVNIIGIHSYDRISWFGGNISNHQLLRIWNPIGGNVSWINAAYVTNITIFKF